MVFFMELKKKKLFIFFLVIVFFIPSTIYLFFKNYDSYSLKAEIKLSTINERILIKPTPYFKKIRYEITKYNIKDFSVVPTYSNRNDSIWHSYVTIKVYGKDKKYLKESLNNIVNNIIEDDLILLENMKKNNDLISLKDIKKIRDVIRLDLVNGLIEFNEDSIFYENLKNEQINVEKSFNESNNFNEFVDNINKQIENKVSIQNNYESFFYFRNIESITYPSIIGITLEPKNLFLNYILIYFILFSTLVILIAYYLKMKK